MGLREESHNRRALKVGSLAPPNWVGSSPPLVPPPVFSQEAGQTAHLLGVSLEDEDNLSERQLLQKAWEAQPKLAPHQIKHALSRPSGIPGLVDWQLVVSTKCPVPFTIGGAVSSPGTFVKAGKAPATETPGAPTEPSWSDASDDFAYSQAVFLLNKTGEVELDLAEAPGQAPPSDTGKATKADIAGPAAHTATAPLRGRGGRITKTRTSSPRKASLRAGALQSPLRRALHPLVAPPTVQPETDPEGSETL